MSTVSLPHPSSLTTMRREARRLRTAFRARQPDALGLVERHAPRSLAAPALPLHLAQLVVARAHGFRSWPALKHYFDLTDGHRFDGSTEPADEPPADRFCRLATLRYDGDDPTRRTEASALLAAVPDLVHAHIWAAATAADLDAVGRHLDQDPSLASRRGGPYRWGALYYLAYARPAVTAEAVIGTARLLLSGGADPNEGYLWGGQPTPFTLLTGVFGEGEQGPEAQPAHPHMSALARLLLEAGADPNDGQTLYNRMFQPADDHLELLFAFGLGSGDGGPWRALMGDVLDTPIGLLRSQLSWAIDHGFAGRVRLLLDHGVDPALPLPDGRDPVAAALVAGQGLIVGVLMEAGAAEPDLDPVEALIAAVMSGDRERSDLLVAADPGLTTAARRRRPGLMVWATAQQRPDALRLLAGLGFDPSALGRGDAPIEQEWQTALHQAAGDGDVALVALLLDLGADPNVLDRRFHATPASWARHFGYDEIVEMLGDGPDLPAGR
ncbi:MAG: ankyrin repeat domain-containing protein [Nakamurella sp.]